MRDRSAAVSKTENLMLDDPALITRIGSRISMSSLNLLLRGRPKVRVSKDGPSPGPRRGHPSRPIAPPQGEHHSRQSALAGPGAVAPPGPLGHQRDKGHEYGNPGDRATLRRRPRRHMDVDVDAVETGRVDAERRRAVLDDAQRRLRAFLHDVAELPGENEFALARNPPALDEQD